MVLLKKILVKPLAQIPILTAIIMLGMWYSISPWESMENRNYDFWADHFRDPGNQPIEIIAIDNKSIQQFGDWPWPRTKIADMVQYLTAQRTNSLGICLLYTHPDVNPGMEVIADLKQQIQEQKWRGGKRTTNILEKMLNQSEAHLDRDRELISGIRRARNVILPIRFTKGKLTSSMDTPLSGLMIINSLNADALAPEIDNFSANAPAAFQTENAHRIPKAMGGVIETFNELAAKAGGLGFLNLQEDPDGIVRRAPLLIEYEGRLFPSFALHLAIKYMDTQIRDLIIDKDFFDQPLLRLKHLQLSTDDRFSLLVNHDQRWIQQRRHSFVDVIEGKVDPAIFKNKIVLLGVTNEDLTGTYHIGSHGKTSMVELSASILGTILSPVRLSRPSWTRWFEIAALLYFAFFLIFVIPRVHARLGASILTIFMATWYIMAVGLLLGYGYHIKPFGPIILTCSGFFIIHFTIYVRKREQEKLEANKTLGLTYQGQGMLDMAYERFMMCPVEDATVKNLLYNLALDFERKRMFNKALAIYKQIRIEGTFKDIEKRCERLEQLDSTMALSVGGSGSNPSLIIDDATTKPTFGRYELLKELGRGSMGTVYLGQDPKINREVAIKTLAYSNVAPSELEDIKTRFFREAEAAGKLSHPNIVSIHDVGEEHDMAYIAMELLSGEDLAVHCKPDNLVPIERTLSIILEVANALDYAHRQGVVHRDIKPANIMILEDGRTKVTDFGIAQVIDASQTKTGVILGTPNYMSPEQVKGETTDGRSDLFSLGVVFYELLTGHKPFKGETITAIMYAINNNAYTPLEEYFNDIPPCCANIVKKLLEKRLTKRYRSAGKVAEAIKECMAQLKSNAVYKEGANANKPIII